MTEKYEWAYFSRQGLWFRERESERGRGERREDRGNRKKRNEERLGKRESGGTQPGERGERKGRGGIKKRGGERCRGQRTYLQEGLNTVVAAAGV